MTIKEYIKINSKNTVLNGKDYNFNEVYSFYLSFKKFGKELYKEYNLKPIIIEENNIIDLPWPFLTINTINISTYFLQNEIDNYFNKLETEISKNEIYSLAILIGEISRILIFYNNHGDMDSIKSKVFNIVESINRKNPIIFEYNDINCFPCLFEKLEIKNPRINLMKEDLRTNNDSIIVNHNYLNIISLIMHFIKIEIMYYTSIIKYTKQPKKCNNCHNLFVGKSDLCEDCARARAAARRNINKKCKLLRDNINNCLYNHREKLPAEISIKADMLLEDDHKYSQYQDLKNIYDKMLKYTNKKS